MAESRLSRGFYVPEASGPGEKPPARRERHRLAARQEFELGDRQEGER